MKQNKQKDRPGGKEEVFIVKPVVKGYGLDYLHLTLIILVVILVALSFSLTLAKPATLVRCSNSTSASGCSSPSAPLHNESQVLSAAEHALVFYGSLNTSLSLLPYYSLVNRSTVSYVPSGKYWLVVIPYVSPFNRSVIYNFSMIVTDSNLSVRNAFINSVTPVANAGKSVVALGTVGVDQTAACNTTKPIPIYLITDPYAPGAFQAIDSAINASARYGNSIAVKYFMVFSSYSISRYQGFGTGQTQLLGNYMFCASKQRNFRQFMSNLSIAYTGEPLDNLTLAQVAQGSMLNTSSLNGCLTNSSTAIDYQAVFAQRYNITSTPQLLVNCKYLTIPQRLDDAIDYSLSETGSG
jgi:hypothetical protein